MFDLQQRLVRAAKTCLFAGRGEPYRIGNRTLRFVPGTRPVRLHHRTSDNAVNRYDALQLAWMLDHLAEGDVAIDVGANRGQCTLVMAEKCGVSGEVIAFEPGSDALRDLSRNFDLNPSIKRATMEACACSDFSGEVELFHNGNTANSALVPLGARDPAAAVARTRVPVTTLDSYFARRHLPEPRLVKIDAEGAEIRILLGARNLLTSKAKFLCELHPYAWPQYGNSLSQLKELASRHGRRIRYLDQDSDIGEEAHYGIVSLDQIRQTEGPFACLSD